MRGKNCKALWIKALYKCSPFTIYHLQSGRGRVTEWRGAITEWAGQGYRVGGAGGTEWAGCSYSVGGAGLQSGGTRVTEWAGQGGGKWAGHGYRAGGVLGTEWAGQGCRVSGAWLQSGRGMGTNWAGSGVRMMTLTDISKRSHVELKVRLLAGHTQDVAVKQPGCSVHLPCINKDQVKKIRALTSCETGCCLHQTALHLCGKSEGHVGHYHPETHRNGGVE